MPENSKLEESLKYVIESCVNLEELNFNSCSIDCDPKFLDYFSNNCTPSILKLDLCKVKNYDDNALCQLVKRCSKLQTLDIRGTEVTWYGISAIIDNLPRLEYLALPLKIGYELGLENKIDMLKMEKLRSMKQLKCLLIDMTDIDEILAKEMPQLIRPEDGYFNVGAMDDSRHKQVEFLPPTRRSQELQSESESE